MDLIRPEWPAPANVQAAFTTRQGGVSQGVYQGLNLGLHVSDDPALVMQNRQLLSATAGIAGCTDLAGTGAWHRCIQRRSALRYTATSGCSGDYDSRFTIDRDDG